MYNRAVLRTILIALFAAAALLVAQNAAGWNLALEVKGALKAGPPVPVQVTLKDAKGAMVEAATIELVVTMVDMDHGESKYQAQEVKPGIYEAKPKFLMEGKWNIAVRAAKGADSASMNLQVEVAE